MTLNMIRIGRFRIGFVAVSVIVVFVALSICAVVAAVSRARPEWSMPLSSLIIINEAMALAATLVYGIMAHFAVVVIDRLRKG